MATRAEHYATMMKDVRDEINEDRIKCFTDPEDGTHFTQFADGSVIDDGGSAFSSKTWEEIVLPNFGGHAVRRQSQAEEAPCDTAAEDCRNARLPVRQLNATGRDTAPQPNQYLSAPVPAGAFFFPLLNDVRSSKVPNGN